MPPRVYGFGSNLFSNIVQSSSEPHCLLPVLLPEVEAVEAASFSQTVVRCSLEKGRRLRGFSEDWDTRAVGRQLLGEDTFTATRDEDGRLSAMGDQARNAIKFKTAAMNAKGEILAVAADEPATIYFFATLAEALDTARLPTVLSSPSQEPILKIIAGGSHFVLLTPSSVLSYGDNRFKQCGMSHSSFSSTSLSLIEYFEGLASVEIAAGDVHSAVVTADGSLYVFGADMEGQCGGNGGEPNLVDLGDGDLDDEPEIVSVACGSSHTVVRTKSGDVWVAGSNHAGQLGLGDTDSRKTFVRNPFFNDLTASNVTCSRWTTFVTTTLDS